MHVPDGFLNVPTSVATGVIAAAAVGVSLRRARRDFSERTAPLAGLVSTFIFATQMLNFPVGAGTSGHLLGGALAVALVGPWTAVLCMTVVFVVQCLLFADGGITALGTNIDLMGLVTIATAALVMQAAMRFLPKRNSSIVASASVAALLSVPIASLAFVGLYAIGGQAPIPIGALAAAMVGWHSLIGVGEATITGLVVASVVRVRPDIVWAVRLRGPRRLAESGHEVRVDA